MNSEDMGNSARHINYFYEDFASVYEAPVFITYAWKRVINTVSTLKNMFHLEIDTNNYKEKNEFEFTYDILK